MNLSSERARFLALVPDEAAAERIFMQVRWPDGVTCAQCGSREMTRLATRQWWQCRDCRAQTSLRSGTVLHRTRKPLHDWLFAAWVCSTASGASTRSIAAQLGGRYATVWVMVHKLRAALAERQIWPLTGEVALAAAALRATKRAKGDPDLRAPVVVAIGAPLDPGPDAMRMHTATSPNQPDAELLADARYAHVDQRAKVEITPTRLDGSGLSRAPAVIRSLHRSLRLWLTQRFGGVSRRYMANYLAQYTYVGNRWTAGDRRFWWVVRRIASEPWRQRADIAVSTP